VTLIMRHRWTWSGFSGAPGYTNFFALGTASQAFVDGIRVFLSTGTGSGVSGILPDGVTLTPDPQVDIVNDTSGFLDQQQAITPPANVVGAGGAAFGSPMGVVVGWSTNGIATGPSGRPRRVRGRTFIVPCNGTAFDTNGTFSNSKLSTLQAAAVIYVAGSWNPCIWHRPTAPGATDGSSHRIVTAQVKDKAAILTSRRD